MIKLTITDAHVKYSFRTCRKIKDLQELTDYFATSAPHERVYEVDIPNNNIMPIIENFINFIDSKESVIESIRTIFKFEGTHNTEPNGRYFDITNALEEPEVHNFYIFYNKCGKEQKINIINSFIFNNTGQFHQIVYKIINVKFQSLFYKKIEEDEYCTNSMLFFIEFVKHMFNIEVTRQNELCNVEDKKIFYSRGVPGSIAFYQRNLFEHAKHPVHTLQIKGNIFNYFCNDKKVEKPLINTALYKQILIPVNVYLEIKTSSLLDKLLFLLIEDRVNDKLLIKVKNKNKQKCELNISQIREIKQVFGSLRRNILDTEDEEIFFSTTYTELSYKIHTILENYQYIDVFASRKKEKNIEIGDIILTNNKKQAIVVKVFNTNDYKKDSLILLENEKSGRKFLKYEKDVNKILKKNENKTVKQTTKPQTVKEYFENYDVNEFYEPVEHIQEQHESPITENNTEQISAGNEQPDVSTIASTLFNTNAIWADGTYEEGGQIHFLTNQKIREYMWDITNSYDAKDIPKKSDDSF